MLFFLSLLLVAFLLAKIGIWLMNLGIPKEAEYDQAAEDRMARYRTWLKGDGRVVNKGCIDGDHSSMVLFSNEDPSKVDAVICSKCTDTLPTPVALFCADCSVVAVDGYLLKDLCTKHDKEPAWL